MSDDTTPVEGTDPARDRPTIAPFVGALVVIALVVIGILAIDGSGGGELTPEQVVSRAVVGQNDALQREDFAAYRDYTCAAAQGDEAAFTAGQKASVEQNGDRYVDGVADVRIDGERATATVTYSFENSRDDKKSSEVRLVGDGGAWKVCPE